MAYDVPFTILYFFYVYVPLYCIDISFWLNAVFTYAICFNFFKISGKGLVSSSLKKNIVQLSFSGYVSKGLQERNHKFENVLGPLCFYLRLPTAASGVLFLLTIRTPMLELRLRRFIFSAFRLKAVLTCSYS